MKKRIWIYRIIFIAALVVFVYAAVNLYIIFMDYKKGANEYEGLQEFITNESTDVDSAAEDEPIQEEVFTVDFVQLKEVNPDCIGWIRIENIGISYPVVQGQDNDYYLKHTFYGERRTAGSVFAEYQNSPDFTDSNTFLYGHNMKDGTMFAKLNQYEKEEFAIENPYFWIYTPEYSYRYDIFSCYVADVDAEVLNATFTNEKEYEAWIQDVIGHSNYGMGIAPIGTDKIVTLMTCTPAGDNYRFLVHGVQRIAIPVE